MPDHSGLLTRAAPLRASTWDAENFTVSAVLSTGAAVTRTDIRGVEYSEVLDLNQNWPASIPLLDSHSRGSVDDRLGEVVDIKTVGNEVVGTVKLSRHNERAKRVAAELSDGATYAVSIGYAVTKWVESKPNGVRTLRAASLTLHEASLTTVPADPGAGLRSIPTLTTTPSTTTQTRAEINAAIRAAATAAGQTAEWANTHIDAEASIETVNAAALAALAARTATAPSSTQITVDHTDPVAIRSAMSDALAHRLAPTKAKAEGRALEYRSHTLLDLVADMAIARGEKVNVRDRENLMERAVGAHSTSDFPLLLADATNKAVLPAYQLAQPTYRRWSARRTFNNFSDHSFLRIGDFPAFKEVGEGAEIRYGSISEDGEKIQVKEFNTGFALTRRAIIQDNLGELADFSAGIANRAAADENKWMYQMLAANGALRDGTALFHASHGNLNPGAALSVASVGVAVASLRKQKSKDGLALNLIPAVLVVGPDNELEARKILAQITATKSGDINPWSNAFDLVIDANITDLSWYVMASPDVAPTFVHGWLAGEEGPQIRTEVEFDTRSVKVAANLTFGHGAVDFRGAQKTPAAG